MSHHLLIAAGGTGGHMFPAQALAEAMLDLGWRVTLSTDARGLRYADGFPTAVRRVEMRSATPARGGRLAKLTVPLRIGQGLLTARQLMRADRPDVIAGFGGYPSIPAMIAGGLMGIPRLIHEQNGVMGRVNSKLASRVDRVACGIWPTELPDGVSATHTGNPIRGRVLALAGSPYRAPDAQGRLNLLVIGGSQGARLLSDALPAALAEFPEQLRDRLDISHQARPEDHDRVRDAYASAGLTPEIQAFFEDVPERLARAQLVISRAGASSVADITAIGRPSILIPLATAAGDHQTANARALASSGAAILIPERILDAPTLARDIRAILTDPARARTMAAAAASQGRPDAAQRLVSIVQELTA